MNEENITLMKPKQWVNCFDISLTHSSLLLFQGDNWSNK